MNFLIKILIVIGTCWIATFGQENYFPHNVGDQWYYEYWNGGFFTSYNILVTKDSVNSDNSHFLFYDNSTIPKYLIDSTNNVYRRDKNSFSYLMYNLNADSGEVWENPTSGSFRWVWVADVNTKNVFSRPTNVKIFQYGPVHPDSVTTPYVLTEHWLAEGYGLIYEWAEPGYFSSLIGCIIKNDSIGITTSVEYQEEIPYHFKIYQNYPNPFNPSTTIKYQIPETGFVTIKIYDVLGKEVMTLVNEKKSIGNYDVQFDASDLVSGMYIYQLKVNNFVASKKMLFVK